MFWQKNEIFLFVFPLSISEFCRSSPMGSAPVCFRKNKCLISGTFQEDALGYKKGGRTMRVLIAEDEVEIAKALKLLLERNKFTVDIVHNGKDAWIYISQTEYNVIVLDIMMPGMDGMEVLRRIRAQKMTVPVLLLTAKGEIEDRVAGLNAGADDYLPKPFASSELIARVKALSRRSMNYTDSVLTVGNVSLDCNCYVLSVKSRSIRLNNKEFQMMELFMKHPRHVFSTEHIMEKIWGNDSETGMDVVWTYIGFLRKKLRQLKADVEIKTIRGAGYALEEGVC